MKGLLVKDLRLVFKRRQQLFILLAICVMIAFTSDGSFAIGYAALLTGMLGLTPLAHDERNNAFPFLFSLPVDARTYVNERYLFCILADVAGILFGVALFAAACVTKGATDQLADGLCYAALYLPATMFLLLTILTIQMIFGLERSRLITFVLYGIIFVLAAVAAKAVGPLDGGEAAKNLPEWIRNPAVIASAAIVLVAAVGAVLYRVCLRTMQNREF